MKEHGKHGSYDMKEEIHDQNKKKINISVPHSCAMCQEQIIKKLILPMTKRIKCSLKKKKCFCTSKVQEGNPCTSAP